MEMGKFDGREIVRNIPGGGGGDLKGFRSGDAYSQVIEQKILSTHGACENIILLTLR